MMIDQDERVILVDMQDQPVGLMDKLQAHVEGVLHRAFSVLIFNATGEILLQQRAMHKYHSQGLWTNACCSHPRKNEDMLDAAHRRLVEEMGFDCPLTKIDVLHYQTPPLDTGLIENEMLHLFAGRTTQQDFTPEPSEVMAWQWISPAGLQQDVTQNTDQYSYWFRVYLQKYDMAALCASLI